ncbi:NAD-dependent formate dehydrogenase subunit alpha [Caballeronia calidae]|uniref:NAD-dependent formate dehydrogenase subunit alpha n=1 Tax=Caballeronia calidae TaxID=1777139 RepID=A0A158EF50_9BURK|nr:2Fe-2S iron-sulfur cluster-binding protein [Caballeronia calidae]SAL05016.1 NAD-dependent formate dehydrogenase subunit alpha [Caballeronia calidae]
MSEALVTVRIDGRSVNVTRGSSVAAAVALAAGGADVVTRRSVSGAARGPLCGMGVCQECRVTIDGVRHRLACQTLCAEGMSIETGRTFA